MAYYPSPSVFDQLRDTIKQAEGTKKSKGRHMPYTCTGGALTIGWGHNLSACGISEETAEDLLFEDMDAACVAASKLVPNLETHPNAVQAVLIEMAFQLGYGGLRQFKRMLAFVNQRQYKDAADQLLFSRFATQTPARAKRLSQMLALASV